MLKMELLPSCRRDFQTALLNASPQVRAQHSHNAATGVSIRSPGQQPVLEVLCTSVPGVSVLSINKVKYL